MKKHTLTYIWFLLRKVLRRASNNFLKPLEKRPYIFSNDTNFRYAVISYITGPFNLRFLRSYMLKHQNKETAILICDVFKSLGFNVFVFDASTKLHEIRLPKEVDVVFGEEPLFEELCKIHPESKKLYFATGAYYEHQNAMVRLLTDELNQLRNVNLPYYRLVKNHSSDELADVIVQIGSSYTLQTYPKHLRKKIRIVRQNTFEFLNYNEQVKKETFSKTTFLYFAGGGSVLKGLHIVLDYFSKRPDLKLHVVAPVEREFAKVFSTELFETKNIFFHGSLPINSHKLLEIANESSFVVLPSGSEGGAPGSVLHMMRLGMVPIVSKYAAFDGIENIGFLLKEISTEALDEAVSEALRLSKEELLKRFKFSYEFVKNNYNSKTFTEDLTRILNECLE